MILKPIILEKKIIILIMDILFASCMRKAILNILFKVSDLESIHHNLSKVQSFYILHVSKSVKLERAEKEKITIQKYIHTVII